MGRESAANGEQRKALRGARDCHHNGKETAITTVSNKTHRPLSVPLPRGKILHLGPGKTGQISVKDIDHPPLKKLVDAGEIEIVAEGHRPSEKPGDEKKGKGSSQGHSSVSGSHRSGDR